MFSWNKSIDQPNQGFPKRLNHENYQTTSSLNLYSFPSEGRIRSEKSLSNLERTSFNPWSANRSCSNAWSCRFLLLAHIFFHLHLIKYLLDVVRIRVPCYHALILGPIALQDPKKNSIKFSKQETTIRNRSKTNAAQIRCTGTSWHFGSCRCRCRSFPAWTDSKR